MAQIDETDLPGVGIRYDFTTRRGERIGVLVHRTGRREVYVYDREDPDACRIALDLDEQDAVTLTEVLGVSQVSHHLEAMQQDIEGLALDWINVPTGSPLAGSTLKEAAIHTRTGVSIVASLHDDTTTPAPGADHVIRTGEVLVAVGTTEGLRRLAALLTAG